MIENKPHILAVAGPIGAGKGTVSEMFDEFIQKDNPNAQIFPFRFSDILRSGLDALGIEASRQNLQKIGLWVVDKFGPDALSIAAHRIINKNTQADVIKPDGMRWYIEAEMIKQLNYPNTIVFVTAPQHLRYHRVKDRGEKPEEHNMSFETFQKQDNQPTEKEIPQIAMISDYIIFNNGDSGNLSKKVSEIYKRRFILNHATFGIPRIINAA